MFRKLHKIFRKLTDKQSTTPMESKVFEKCDPKEEFLAISHTPLTISQIKPKIQNTKSTVGALCKANNCSTSSSGLTKPDFE